ncbi:MAG: hypothetical protein JNJ57_00105 [Saprospiraceae bacterium]|nr:hypothetical protein [Saprospiraceae bacterium]
MQTPVLLLFFNRPDQAGAVLDRVREARPARVYVHVDGPRPNKDDEVAQVEKCRSLVQSIDWPCEIFTLFRTENKGLRHGVYDALNWFFTAEPEGIILEDDCIPDHSFFQFCETLLKEYRFDNKIMHIAGSNVAERFVKHLPQSVIFSKFSLVWGWASWRRAWQQMTLEFEGLESFVSEEKIKGFIRNPMAQTYMLDKFETTKQGKNNSWAYAWFYSILKNEGLCIVPARNLIQNTGVGTETATNTKASLKHQQVRAGKIEFPLILPTVHQPDPAFEIQLFYHTQKQKWRLFLWYCLHAVGLR